MYHIVMTKTNKANKYMCPYSKKGVAVPVLMGLKVEHKIQLIEGGLKQ
jgi:hypothetical protein